ncbi:MAG: cytochrome P450 [Aliishimia sp.]
MTHITQSLTDDAFVQNPYPFYDAARAKGPVLFWNDMNMLAAFDHVTVSALLRDRRLGRAPLQPRVGPDHLAPFHALEVDSMLELEPPRHKRLRGLVLRAFTSRRIGQLQPDVQDITTDVLSGLPKDMPFDLIPDFCQPIPVRIIARLLGVPESLAPELLEWSRDMVAMYQTGVTLEIEQRAGRAAQAFTDFMHGYIKERRAKPADDLITELIKAEQDGERLSTDEMISTCILLLNAGHEATVHSLGNAVRVLIEHDTCPTEQSAQAITEEVLRYEAPLHIFTRFAYEQLDLPGNQVLQRGDEVALVLGAANRDPAFFSNPHRFDPSRQMPKHTSFGGGLHFCVGAPLARAEIQTALPMLFERFPNLRLHETPQFANAYHFHKHDSLFVHP